MDLSPKILGTHTANALRSRASAALVRIGRDTFTRVDLAGVACFNFQAAANLSAILNRELKPIDTADVFNTIPPEALAVPRLGAIAIAVLGACFEKKRLGGSAPLESWMRKHHEAAASLVTFDTIKHRDDAERAAARKHKQDRKTVRRDKAHRIRTSRFLERQAKAVS